MKKPVVDLPEIELSIRRVNSSDFVRIYLLLDPDTNEIRYVGKTEQDLEKRFEGHLAEKSESELGRYKVRWVQKLTRKGKQPKIFSLARVPFEEWEYWERYFIVFYRALGCRLTNMTIGGEYGGSVGPRSESFRKKRSIIQKKFVKTEKFQIIVDKIRKKNIGKKRNLLSKRKIGYGQLGKQHSEESRINFSKTSSKARNFTEMQKQKMRFGKEVSRKKKKVFQLTLSGELVQIWESRRLAESIYGSNIGIVTSGKQYTAYGFIWTFFTPVVDWLVRIKESFAYVSRTIYCYSLEGVFCSRMSYTSFKELYGNDTVSLLKIPTSSKNGMVFRLFFKKNLEDISLHELPPENFKSNWDLVLSYYQKNKTLEGFPFKDASATIPRYDVKSRRVGVPSQGVVVRDKQGNEVEKFESVTSAQEKYTWRVIEYLKKRREHPELIFEYTL